VAEIGLQGAGIVAFVGEGEAAGMAQHVRVGLEAKLGRRAYSIRTIAVVLGSIAFTPCYGFFSKEPCPSFGRLIYYAISCRPG